MKKKEYIPNDDMINSSQINWYDNRIHRRDFDLLYKSEKVTLSKILPETKSILDIGCLNGDAFGAIKDRFGKDIECIGVDVDADAIDVAKKNFPDCKFHVADFMDKSFKLPPSDLVMALNVFDHFSDWKTALINLKRFSKKYINFSTLLRFSGQTVLDKDLSFIHYSFGDNRVLWIAHNIWELCAYCTTEHINASSIYVYCYTKYTPEKVNMKETDHSVIPLPFEELFVGNVTITVSDTECMSKTIVRPDVTIVANDKVVFDSPWKKH